VAAMPAMARADAAYFMLTTVGFEGKKECDKICSTGAN
jgi:hypothetical protein